ncbi:hypothetical protein [Nocardiopsis sp. NPDC058789]|uniref:hypothetical protein n=1 Tax=Nocardiopsis sp. NPDC058789 TaxID=3346634 RepID=UPI0036720529
MSTPETGPAPEAGSTPEATPPAGGPPAAPDLGLPGPPQGAPPPPPPHHLPPRPPVPEPPQEEPTRVRPSRHWYWTGTLFPVSLLVSILLLSGNPGAAPGLVVGGVLTPMLAFLVSLITCVTVLVIRSSRIARRRGERARREHMAFTGAPVGPPVFHPGYAPPPPRIEIPAGDLRPRRRSILASALVLPVGVAVGVTAIVTGFSYDLPPEHASEVIRTGGTVTFEVTEEQTGSLGLYSNVPHEDEDGISCVLDGAGAPRLTEKVVGYSHEEWRLVRSVELSAPGEYDLTCTGRPGLEYVVADTDVAVAYDKRMMAGFGTLMLSVVLGFFVSLILVITLSVKRGEHRSRLVREHQVRAQQAWVQARQPGPPRH